MSKKKQGRNKNSNNQFLFGAAVGVAVAYVLLQKDRNVVIVPPNPGTEPVIDTGSVPQVSARPRTRNQLFRQWPAVYTP